MKMKKIVLLFSMIAVLFSLTGCSDGQEKLDFEYDNINITYNALYQSYEFQNATDAYRALLENSENELASVLIGGVSNFDTVEQECGEFVGYRLKDGSSDTVDFAALQSQDDAVYYAALEAVNLLVANVDVTIEESGNTVILKIPAEYEKRDVIYTYIYEKNPAYDYYEEFYGESVPSFQIKEVTAAPDYSMGEKMSKAAMNTLMGMGTVFIVLIFIAFVIGQFEKINKASVAIANWWENRKNKNSVTESEEASQTESVPVVAPIAVANPMDDSQLVAVITAAVVAASTATGGTDKLIVRSIRKAKR